VGVALSGKSGGCWREWGAWGPTGREKDGRGRGGETRQGQLRRMLAWAARGLGPHVRISLVPPRPSRGAAQRAMKDGPASLLSTVTVRPTSTMADSGQLRSPCSTISRHSHSPHPAIFRKTVCSSKGGDGGGDSAPSVIGHEERQEVV